MKGWNKTDLGKKVRYEKDGVICEFTKELMEDLKIIKSFDIEKEMLKIMEAKYEKEKKGD
jgi:hypothetical protein